MSGDSREVAAATQNIIAWDSCVFLAHFNNETDKDQDAIDDILQQLKSGGIAMVVSAICAAEVLNSATSQSRTNFEGFLRRGNVIRADVDFRIARLAALYRERSRADLDAGVIARGIRAPDALIIATAVTYRAAVLHSYDPDMRALSQRETIDRLRIEPPARRDRG